MGGEGCYLTPVLSFQVDIGKSCKQITLGYVYRHLLAMILELHLWLGKSWKENMDLVLIWRKELSFCLSAVTIYQESIKGHGFYLCDSVTVKAIQDDVRIENDGAFTFISDRQKGLINALEAIFPTTEHRQVKTRTKSSKKSPCKNQNEDAQGGANQRGGGHSSQGGHASQGAGGNQTGHANQSGGGHSSQGVETAKASAKTRKSNAEGTQGGVFRKKQPNTKGKDLNFLLGEGGTLHLEKAAKFLSCLLDLKNKAFQTFSF
ncbi:hypothetical protein POM88_024950 [Heracleum sosnowskyi]|uniref:Uncharacterized protein n=1 Tax=Heracleum sosnowskyi TaxID=360622 RepID=A0AAD8I402_9APIA|nr:hypothetical protein POM88_024950 [Heracleum sosnowskyi]